MGGGEVVDVDVIADAGSIGSGIIVAEDRDSLALPERRLQDDRNQVRLGRVVLAQIPLGAGAGGVEVAQRRISEAVGPCVVGQRALDDQLGEPVGIDGLLRLLLGDWNPFGFAVGGGRAGEYDLQDAGRAHRFEQRQAGDHVVLIILGRVRHRLADQGESGEVHHRLDLALAQSGGNSLAIGQFAFDQPPGRNRQAVAERKIVVDPDFVSGAGEQPHGVAADITGAAGDEDVHGLAFSASVVPPPLVYLNFAASLVEIIRSLAMLKRKKNVDIEPPPRKAEHPWATSFADYLRSECHLADNTVAAYRRDLRRFYDWLGERRIPKLTIRELADYAGWLHEQKLAPASLARHLVSLKLFFRYLQLEGILVDN